MLNETTYRPEADEALLIRIKNGDREALAQLVDRHYAYIYNVALKFFNGVQDAEDAAQEVIIKVITNIGSFDPEKAQLRTWLYRITVNHFLNARKSIRENLLVGGFPAFFDIIDSVPDDAYAPEEATYMQDTIEEAKTACMAGMLLCLTREQRLTYILGELFDIDHKLGGDIFGISPANFRQRLSRTRRELYQWMTNRCGLVNQDNPCRCPKKTKGFVAKGFVNPDNKMWHSNTHQRIYEVAETKKDEMLLAGDEIYAALYREHPFKDTAEQSRHILNTVLAHEDFAETLNLR